MVMTPAPHKESNVVLFIRGDKPLEMAWKKLLQMAQPSAFTYMWSESQTGKLEHLHHFQNIQTKKYLEIEA